AFQCERHRSADLRRRRRLADRGRLARRAGPGEKGDASRSIDGAQVRVGSTWMSGASRSGFRKAATVAYSNSRALPLTALIRRLNSEPRQRSDAMRKRISLLTLLLRETVNCQSRQSNCFLIQEGSRCFGSEIFPN